MERGDSDPAAVTTYEEYAPDPALRPFVRAIFAYRPGPPRPSWRRVRWSTSIAAGAPFSGPMIASAGASIVVPLGEVCIDGEWKVAGSGDAQAPLLMGPSTRSHGSAPRTLPAMVGAYLRPGHLSTFLRAPGAEVADRAHTVRSIIGVATGEIVAGFEHFAQNGELAELERALLRRFGGAAHGPGGLDVASALEAMTRSRGALPVATIADRAGASRQHLARLVRERTGLTPKAIGRLARFHGTLARIGRDPGTPWAIVAADSGYADQSHMIREFQCFTGCTPRELTGGGIFHPFVRAGRTATPAGAGTGGLDPVAYRQATS